MPDKTKKRELLLHRGREFLHASRSYAEGGECLDGVIMALIADGSDTRDAIIAMVPSIVPVSYRHAAVAVDRGTGDDPKSCYWYRDETKRYHLHAGRRRRPRPAKLQRIESAPSA